MNIKNCKCMAAIMMAMALGACSSDELNLLADKGGQLSILPTIGGSQAANVNVETRAEEAGDDALSENVIGNTLDIFIAGQGGDTYWNQYHLTGVTAGTEKLLTYDCLKGDKALTAGSSYKVYVSANTAATNGTIASEAELKALSINDADIYRHEGTVASNGCQENKRFVMDYSGTLTVNAESKNTIDAQMSRAAAKFKVKVQFDPTFYSQLTTTDGYTVNSPAWRLFNCNTSAPLFADGDAVTPTLTDAPRFSLDKTAGDVYDIVTYSYPFSWTDQLEGAPYILFSYELSKAGKTDHVFHYYRIPLTDLTALQRNHVYEVTATIKSYGSTTTVASTNDVDLSYKVIDWKDDAAPLNGVLPYYIMAEPDFTVLSGDGSQTATISIFAPESIWALGSAGIKIQAGSFKSYYKNYNLVQQNTSDTQSGTVSIDYTNRTLTVTSTALTNHAVKYINFVLYYEADGNTYSQKVYFKHYPTDNIQPVMSSWSSYDNTSWARYSNPQRSGTVEASGMFIAKVWNGSKIVNLTSSGGIGTTDLSLPNPHMYVVLLTAPNNSYDIKRPLDKEGNVCSPAFMIASQLGAVSGSGSAAMKEFAASETHAANYMEVDAKGNEYTDWRLPTAAELKIITTFQPNAGAVTATSVIDRVLAAGRYHAIDKQRITNTGNSYGSTSNTTAAVRCVRDLTPEEVENLRNTRE